MKRMLTAALAVAAMSAMGQTHYSSNVSLGVKAGATMSQVMFNPSVKQDFAAGITGGIMFRYVEENHFGLIAELSFTQKGWKENFEGAPYNYTRTIDWVELPVMTHIYFGRRGRFFFNAGPQVGLYLGDKTKANFDPLNTSGLEGFPHINRRNEQMAMKISERIDYGISAGLGGEFNINKRNSLSVEVRGYFGLGNLFPSDRADIFSASNQLSFSATVGYWFRIK